MGIPEQLYHMEVFKKAYDQAMEKLEDADLEAVKKMIAEGRGAIMAILKQMIELDKKLNALYESHLELSKVLTKHMEVENQATLARMKIDGEKH